jgi:translation elongation factor EF-4
MNKIDLPQAELERVIDEIENIKRNSGRASRRYSFSRKKSSLSTSARI